jgi:DNA modification methylase
MNKLICGDNLKELATMEKESIDLIYIDPPFFSNQNYEIIWGDEAEIRSFEDRWQGRINVYIDWMKQRVIELHRVLKSTGSFYLHCDWHAGHYLKVMCDEIFGVNNFRNEIIWHYKRWSNVSQNFQRMHDVILFYTKSKKYNFNLQYQEYSKPEEIENTIRGIVNGKLQRLKDKNGNFIKREKENIGVPLHDVWDIQHIQPTARERLGYPTQKPEALLERIIKASSNKGDVVLDAFCGCGTALAVAQKLGRQWIGIDISPSAIALIKNRLAGIYTRTEDFEVVGMPQKVDDLKKFKPYEFQYWAINEMHGSPNSRKSGDMGIDGLSFLEHLPIQVKQSESIGRNVIDNFETAMRRTKNTKGYIVAFSFGKGAYEEVARVKKEGLEIILITVQDILDKKYSKEVLW